MTLWTVAAASVGLAIAALLTVDLWYGDWWFAGIVLTTTVLASGYGLLRRDRSPYDDMTVKEARDRQRREPPSLGLGEERSWRLMMVLLCVAAFALPPLGWSVGVGRWQGLIMGALALSGGISYLLVYRLIKRASAAGGSR